MHSKVSNTWTSANPVLVTASAAELNVLDGVASGLTAAELSKMDGVTANTADINVMSTVAASSTVSVADMKMLKDRAVDITLLATQDITPEKLDISELLLEDDGGTCSDTTKTTEAECLYVVKDSTAPLASTHANYLDDTACRAYASSNDLTFGTVNAESFLPAGCVTHSNGQVYYSNGGGHDCGHNTYNCIQKTVNTWTPTYATVTASAAELNVLDGVSITTADLNKIVNITSSTSELNKMDGVTASTADINVLGSTALEIDSNLQFL